MSAFKWFLGFLKKYKWYMVLGLLMTTLISMLALISPYVSGIIVDRVIIGGELSLLPKLIAILLGVTAVRGVLRFFYQGQRHLHLYRGGESPPLFQVLLLF